jgi:hypothetical protein
MAVSSDPFGKFGSSDSRYQSLTISPDCRRYLIQNELRGLYDK